MTKEKVKQLVQNGDNIHTSDDLPLIFAAKKDICKLLNI